MVKKLLLTPFQKFIKTESLAGMLLFGSAIIALIWANSPYASHYEELWQYKIGVSFEDFKLEKALILWINDGLMAIFFFLIGLELKRELIAGEINTLKKASLPFIAALGGVLVPVGLYLFLNQDPSTQKGWGIPMATDIAFALAILSTLGKKAPLSLKVFLTAFAIIDDIAAVLVIALFYSENINLMYILSGIGLVLLLALIYRLKKYTFGIGIVIAVVVWFLFLKSGIHPTIAGVLLAFTIPIKRRLDTASFSDNLSSIASKFEGKPNDEEDLLPKKKVNKVKNLRDLASDVRSPLQHLEHNLHSLIAYFILPVFAFSNAGVAISLNYDFDFALMTNVAVSLFVGKLIGVGLFSYLGIKFGVTELPSGVKFRQIIGASAIAGVGFTMSIFIDNLAFGNDLISMNSAKVGIIIGSLVAGTIGYLILRLVSKKEAVLE